MRRIRKRLLKDERGFTLVEALVTMLMMVTVLFALYSIFDMSLRVFAYGNDKIEAVENARLGLEKMKREIRAAYPVDKANDTDDLDYLFFEADGSTNTANDPPPQTMPTDEQITFGNDLNGDRKLTCPDSDNCEYITYRLDASDSTTLLRNNTDNGSNPSDGGDPVVEYVGDVDEPPDGKALTFTYMTVNEDTGDLEPASSEPEIDVVRIELEIKKGEASQTLTTEVSLGNRSG